MEGGFAPGTVLVGKYRVDGVLARGGMGSVVRVTDLASGEPLAIKTMLPEIAANPEYQARFQREAHAVRGLRSEHIARVLDTGSLADGSPYIAMEYLRGMDLAEDFRRRLLRPGEVVDFVLQACAGLAEAHARQIVHRDIKPSNLFLTARADGTPLIKILDFGISKAPIYVAGLASTRTNLVMGTPEYMSPEQMKTAKETDPRGDIWSLGVVLYEGLMGRRPFQAETYPALVLAVSQAPTPPMAPRIPRRLQAVVLRCLAKDREARFSTIAELAAALAPFAWNRREAAMCVARARLTLRRPADAETTRVIRVRSRARMVAGALLFCGAIALLVVAGVLLAGRLRSGSAGEAVGSAATRSSATEQGDTEQGHTEQGDTGASRDRGAPVVTDPQVIAEAARSCDELAASHRWRELTRCATHLGEIGAANLAERFADLARKENASQYTAESIRRLVEEHNFRSAERALLGFDRSSAYWSSLSSDFARAEDAEVDDVAQRARGAATARACVTLRPEVAREAAETTGRVYAMLATLRCRGDGQLLLGSTVKNKPRSVGLIDI